MQWCVLSLHNTVLSYYCSAPIQITLRRHISELKEIATWTWTFRNTSGNEAKTKKDSAKMRARRRGRVILCDEACDVEYPIHPIPHPHIDLPYTLTVHSRRLTGTLTPLFLLVDPLWPDWETRQTRFGKARRQVTGVDKWVGCDRCMGYDRYALHLRGPMSPIGHGQGTRAGTRGQSCA